jgi:hypothetical protein
MPTVNGSLTYPSLTGRPVSAAIDLVDADGVPLRAFKSDTDKTVIGPQPLDVAADGTYTIDLPGNTALNPSGTRYRRRIHLPGGPPIDDYLVVPATGGPYFEEDILAAPVDPIPEPIPSNLIDSVELTATFTATGINIGAIVLVPLSIVTVPDVAQPVLLRGRGPVLCTSATSKSIVMGIVPAGGASAAALDRAQAFAMHTAVPLTLQPEVLLPAHTPGDYQLFLHTFEFVAIDIRLDATPSQKASLRAFSA